MFHSWLHLVTEEPPVPSEETMRHSIEAQRTAAALFASARQSKRLVRANKNSNRRMENALERHLSKFHDRLEEARAVPEEFQLVNLADYQVDTIDDAYTLTAKLGAFAARGTLTRVRDVLREVAV